MLMRGGQMVWGNCPGTRPPIDLYAWDVRTVRALLLSLQRAAVHTSDYKWTKNSKHRNVNAVLVPRRECPNSAEKNGGQ